MASFQYHLFKPLMRIARWSQGVFPVQDAKAIVRFRRFADRLANALIHPPGEVSVEKSIVGGVAGEWITPLGAGEAPVMIFLHGGGIAFGWNNAMRRELALLARFSGLRAFGVDYPLIPETCYPAAHDACFAVYKALLEQLKRIVLIGESSGAVLALATLLRAKEAGLSQPLLCALISPVVDYGFKDARLWQANDPFAHPRFVVGIHKHYLAGKDATQPDLSPVDADLTGIAPLYVLVGENEIMRSEVDRLTVAAQHCHIPMETRLWPHAWHSWHALAPQLPEATQALETLGRVIQKRAFEEIG